MLQQTESFDSFVSASSGAARCHIPVILPEAQRERETTEANAEEQAATVPLTSGAEGEDGSLKLLERARNGDRAAFDELIQKQYGPCLKRATFLLQNRNDAEDEVQTACYKAFRQLDQYRGEGTFAAWLNRIVENQCLMRIREERKGSLLYLDEANDSNIRLELVAQRANAEDELGEQEVVNLVRREVSLIPHFLRSILLLCDIEEVPIAAVASRLGITIPAAKSRLMRARKELRRRLAKHCGSKGCATLTCRSRYQQAAYLKAS